MGPIGDTIFPVGYIHRNKKATLSSFLGIIFLGSSPRKRILHFDVITLLVDSLNPLTHESLIELNLVLCYLKDVEHVLIGSIHIKLKVILDHIACLERKCGMKRDIFTMIEPRILHWASIIP